MVYKLCVVPKCTSTSIRTPEKLFLSVPKNPNRRRLWLRLARKDPRSFVSHSNVFMCEDHFDMEKDIINYRQYKMGFSRYILLTNKAVPTKFNCQEDRITRMLDAGPTGAAVLKIQRKDLVTECLQMQSATETHPENLQEDMEQVIHETEEMTASPQRSLSRAEGSGVSRTVRVSVKVEPELSPDGPHAPHELTRGNSYFTHFGHNTWDHTYATMDFPSIGVCVKQEPASNESADVIKEELADVIKEEGGEGDEAAEEASGSAGARGSEAAMLAALYAKHVVKDELVLGPEVPHRPHIISLHDARGVSGGAWREPRGGQLALKDCSVRLERCDAPRGAATREPAPGSRAPAHGTAPHTRTDLNAANTYVCDICGKIFKSKCGIIRHVNGHLRENSDVLPNKSNIYERVRASVKPYACDMCNKEFSTLGSLRRHTASDTFECDICGKVINRKDNLRKHVKKHLRDSSKVLSNKSDIYEHVRASLKACDICNKEFSRVANLRRHQRDHHVPNTYGKVIKRKDNLISHVNCEICNKKFSVLSNLQRHRRVHTGERPYSCEICQKMFTYSASLKVHKRIHTGERPYSCDICNKKFSDQGCLQRHRRVHTGERPYSCEICQKKFIQSVSLKAHKRIHTGERPYSCDICKKQFAHSSSIKKHKMTHTGEKQIRRSGKWYSCEICKKTFSCFRSLKSHKLVHPRGRPYTYEEGFMRVFSGPVLTTGDLTPL